MDDRQPLMYGQPSAPPPYAEQPPPYAPGYPPQPYLLPQQGYPVPPPPLSGYGAAPPMMQGGCCGAPPPPMPQGGCCGGQTGMYGQQVTVVRGQPVPSPQVIIAVKPSNYVLTSVIVMIFFCFVFGLIGLIYGLRVDSAWASGDREGARRMSGLARRWNFAGITFGIFILIIVIVSVTVGASTS